jgi:hypothetical protein
LLFLNPSLCFLENIFTGGFITTTASGNRFPLAVLGYPPIEKKNLLAPRTNGCKKMLVQIGLQPTI